MTRYLIVSISSETKEQADKILNSLLEKRLVTGGQIIQAPARFLWKGMVADMDYFSIQSYTLADLKQRVIDDIKSTSVEEVPMITFVPFEGNQELLNWIDQTLTNS